MAAKGAVASGHHLTTAAAEEILRDGGNAFDAIIAAHFMSCVAEPVLSSLGSGGYLLAEPAGDASRVYDFFAQTPISKTTSQLDFYPISADFGPASQEFHIGVGAIATPGSVKGMFRIHRELATLPMRRLVEPAVRAAKEGIVLNALQAYIFSVVSPIYLATPSAAALYGSKIHSKQTLAEGECLIQSEMADTLESLAYEGDDLFYLGEIGARIEQLCQGRGLLTREDLKRYSVKVRPPLRSRYRNAELLTNPPPSSGGMLIAFALSLLEQQSKSSLHSLQTVGRLAGVMDVTNKARMDALSDGDTLEHLLDQDLLEQYRAELIGRPFCSRGTTHISVVDASGNLAAMTVSNGEGCGELVDGTGIMLNNMLGEEDINPRGFFQWQPGTRMTSMMAPSILHMPQGKVVLGSGGSNRIRTAIMQVIINLVDHGMGIEEAVAAPRIHMENGQLNLEPGALDAPEAELAGHFEKVYGWPETNLFFGGVHSVLKQGNEFHAVGDERRDGSGKVVS